MVRGHYPVSGEGTAGAQLVAGSDIDDLVDALDM